MVAVGSIMGWWFAAALAAAILPVAALCIAADEGAPEPTRRRVLRPGGVKGPRTRRPKKRALSLGKELKTWVFLFVLLVAVKVMD
jgi:hypothetical protein